MIDIKRSLGLIKSPYDKRDYLIKNFLKFTPLPAKIDYTVQMTPVRNQGAEGTCVGFATAVGVKEWMEQKEYKLYIPLSPRYVYEYARKIDGSSPDSEGTTLVAATKTLVSKGICEEKFWPYVAQNPGKPDSKADLNASRYKIQPGWARITNEKELRHYLNEYGPTLIGVVVYNNWYREKNGHIPNPTLWERYINGALGGHAICLVGYDDKTQEYKFKNSWGSDWGDNGYGYLTYKHIRQIMMDAIGMIDMIENNHYANRILCDINCEKMGDLPWYQHMVAWK